MSIFNNVCLVLVKSPITPPCVQELVVGEFTVEQVETKIAGLKKAKLVVDKEIAVLDDAIARENVRFE